MSLFKKALASVGIGAAKVDTRLQDDRVMVGEPLRGVVVVKGGDLDQEVASIYLSLQTYYDKESGDSTIKVNHVLNKHQATGAFLLKAGEVREFPFEMVLPYETPPSFQHHTRVYLKTGLDVAWALDPSDSDKVFAQPNALMLRLLQAGEAMGLRFKRGEIEYLKSRHRPSYWQAPYSIELEFKPGGRFSRASEIEFSLFPRAGGLDTLVEVDRKVRSLGDLFRRREVHTFISFEEHHLQQPLDYWVQQLSTAIEGVLL